MKYFSYLAIAATIFGTLLLSCRKSDDKQEGLTFTVTFNSNGGYGISQQIVKKGEKVVKPETPIRYEYGFVGWYQDKGLTTEWKFEEDLVTENITLYAKWEWHVFTITFNSNGGSAVLPQTAKLYGEISKPEDPTRSGYVFVAWYLDEALKIEWNWTYGYAYGHDVTLYARWHSFDEQFKIAGLTIDNYPSVDGSTSTEPLNILIACKLLDIIYRWESPPLLGDFSWGVQPYFKDNSSEKFREKVKSSQTHESFINLIDKKADLILSARTMSSDEKEYAHTTGVSLIETPIALDAFIFIVHPDNPIKTLTEKQIQDIYMGKITNWKEVGGNDAKISPYVRNANSGSQELMELLVMKDLNITEFPISYYELVASSMSGAFDAVVQDSNAICYTIFYYKEYILRGTTVKSIAVNGVYPDKSTISNNSYPYVAEVYATIRSDLDKSSMAYKVYELLQTEEGKRVINESGYLSQ